MTTRRINKINNWILLILVLSWISAIVGAVAGIAPLLILGFILVPVVTVVFAVTTIALFVSLFTEKRKS